MWVNYATDKKGLCPFCHQGLVEGGFIEIDSGYAYQECSCTECGGEWKDKYKLFAYCKEKEGENEKT